MVEALRANEEHRTLLVNELNHRVKNTLATVQAIASQTLLDSVSMRDARAALTARLMALSRAHDVLTGEAWAGADLVDIVGAAVDTFAAGDTKRFQAKDPRSIIAAQRVLFAMALNELCTKRGNMAPFPHRSDTSTLPGGLKRHPENRGAAAAVDRKWRPAC